MQNTTVLIGITLCAFIESCKTACTLSSSATTALCLRKGKIDEHPLTIVQLSLYRCGVVGVLAVLIPAAGNQALQMHSCRGSLVLTWRSNAGCGHIIKIQDDKTNDRADRLSGVVIKQYSTVMRAVAQASTILVIYMIGDRKQRRQQAHQLLPSRVRILMVAMRG
eukprot:6464990-Amphidinium_carterae.1